MIINYTKSAQLSIFYSHPLLPYFFHFSLSFLLFCYKSYMSGKNSSTNFIHKLYLILQDTSYSHIIHWKQSLIQIINIALMEQIVLPINFHHSNFSSFIRQLNMYDFHKVVNLQKNQFICFKHELFLPNRSDLLPLIKRKKKQMNLIKSEGVSTVVPLSLSNLNIFEYHIYQFQCMINNISDQISTNTFNEVNRTLCLMNATVAKSKTTNISNISETKKLLFSQTKNTLSGIDEVKLEEN